MVKDLRIALVQINPTVGAVFDNLTIIKQKVNEFSDKADILVFPELCISGYPPEDLLFRDDFIESCNQAIEALCKIETQSAIVVGHPKRDRGKLFNAMSIIQNGKIAASYYKRFLPNYTVFDEKRYFSPGIDKPVVIDLKGARIGLTICEDIWVEGPVSQSVKAGAELILSINASPFHHNKAIEREETIVLNRAKQHAIPIVYVNQTGGQDELVFDGASFVCDHRGQVTTRLELFEEDQSVVTLKPVNNGANQRRWLPTPGRIADHGSKQQRIYKALTTGVGDYVNKNGFRGVVLGLSGGIDSALVLAIAVDALGKDRVEAVMMPYHYTSAMSKEDAAEQADRLGIKYHVIPIANIVKSTLDNLAPLFAGSEGDTTEENIQARVRGLLLMAISNKKGLMVLATGNKSEMAVGYATLYGDMVGGFAAIKDIPKTLVYQLAKYRNSLSDDIPDRVITRPPSAELKPDQVDQDSLPDYDILDNILERFVEKDESAEKIIDAGFDAKTVNRVVAMVLRNEYKRRQAAPGVRITPRAFGRDRRYPITSGFFK